MNSKKSSTESKNESQDSRSKGSRNGGKSLDANQNDNYDEYLMAMKRVYYRHSLLNVLPAEIQSPRVRYRKRESDRIASSKREKGSLNSSQEAFRIGIIASMVPDEIIFKHNSSSVRTYEAALMFCDISGFTQLCEKYAKFGSGGPSKLTQVLNSYIGAMVQEIMTHEGDVLKFSGDAFLSMWKKTGRYSMQDIVHNAIDCGLIIQKNYGTFMTDVGVVLKVKVAISAGLSHFSIIGDQNKETASYVIVGQPVWDVKMAQYMTNAGDVITAASAWMYVNEAEYCTQPCGDGRHTKVLGVGVTWKREEKLKDSLKESSDTESLRMPQFGREGINEINIREFSLRPALISAMKSSWWPWLRRFMTAPVLRSVDNDEPLEFLTEVRRVVIVFVNIITKTVTPDVLINIVDYAYRSATSVTADLEGLVNKVSMFDKDMMILIVFGLRGIKHENEAQNAILCAGKLKDILTDENILSVSIGVTSGTTYCGVVGHVLRREYTVIGPTVNKAARLMIAYPDIISCDKESFLRSKLEQKFFRQVEAKTLKGIANPGPLYEFRSSGWTEHIRGWRHPILGRNEELLKFKMTLQNAIEQQQRNFTRYRDHVYAVAYSGPKFIGKTRLLDECLYITPDFLRTEKIELKVQEKEPYSFFRRVMSLHIKTREGTSVRQTTENAIRYSVNMMNVSALQIFAMNTVFGCRFPLPEHYSYTGDVLAELPVKQIIRIICTNIFIRLWVLGVDEAQYMDKESWRLLLIVLETKTIFVTLSITNIEALSPVATTCLSSDMIVKVPLSGIDRAYHAALTCQLLDVQAIPADLEKVIESASGGLPGWIQNFVISLVQRGALTIVTVTRNEAEKSGAVMPSILLLQRTVDFYTPDDAIGKQRSQSFQSIMSLMSVYTRPDNLSNLQVNMSLRSTIQMAVLAESYTFTDINNDMSIDALILKIYDSLTSFEKMLLKCGSVLGDVFSRRMLLHLLQSDSQRKVAEAVAKLFKIRVLECEGGDFTRDSSFVLIHPAPTLTNAVPPYCACLGTQKPVGCRDLPPYAFCGYMKFRHSTFRTNTYNLLLENQKIEMHSRALLYLERYTRKCASCGGGCFYMFLGLRSNDGLREENEELKRYSDQIRAMTNESRVSNSVRTSLFIPGNGLEYSLKPPHNLLNYEVLISGGWQLLPQLEITPADTERLSTQYGHKRTRSFASLELDRCECLLILQSVYCQVIDHCRGSGDNEKLLSAYLEYADLCVCLNVNIPQAFRLLYEAEEFIKTEKCCKSRNLYKDWLYHFRLATVYSMRGACMIESGDYGEARVQLFEAMRLLSDPFPTSKHWVKLRSWCASLRQMVALTVPKLYSVRYSEINGRYYEEVCRTLNRLFRLFNICKEHENAKLAAQWSLNTVLRTNTNLRVLCHCYGNMISIYRQEHKFSKCLKLENRALDICRRRHGQMDVTEVSAVCHLYTNIFLFYIECGKKMESLEFGLSVIHWLTREQTRQVLVLSMLKILLCELKLNDMVSIMREFLYLTDQYDLCSETWYYCYSTIVLLDTGYSVETYNSCEKFYIKKGDSLHSSEAPEPAWNFYVCMWLVTIRTGAWERSILWEEKIKQLFSMKFDKKEFHIMIVIRLVEGILITLVKEMDKRNLKKIIFLENLLQSFLRYLDQACKCSPTYRPRKVYYLMYAYYSYLRGKKDRAFNYLTKAEELSKQYSQLLMIIWIDHTQNYWKKTLDPHLVHYWEEHVDAGNLLDYKDFDIGKGNIIPYTFPLPGDFQE